MVFAPEPLAKPFPAPAPNLPPVPVHKCNKCALVEAWIHGDMCWACEVESEENRDD